MPKTLADVEVKTANATNSNAIPEEPQRRHWRRWVVGPLALLTVATAVFVMIRRKMNTSED